MKIEEFQPPNRFWAAFSLIGGVLTAIALITGLEFLIYQLAPSPSQNLELTHSSSTTSTVKGGRR